MSKSMIKRLEIQQAPPVSSPSLKVMLAASEIPEAKDLKFPLMVSPKVDGVRCVHIHGKVYSRKMLPFTNPYLSAWAAAHQGALHGLDGELVVGHPASQFEGDDVFNRSSGPLGKSHGEPDFTFWMFEAWDSQGSASAWSRFQRLQLIAGLGLPRVKLLPQTLVNSVAELEVEYERQLDAGFEGLILKKPIGQYKNGRSTLLEGTLMKWKEFADSEAQVLGWKQGRTNQNEATKDALGHTKRSSAKAGKVLIDSLGSWLVRDIYSGVEFNCGPCGTVEEVRAMWDDRYQCLGKVLTYSFQKVGTLLKGKPRFSGMVRWRPDYDIGQAKFLVEPRTLVPKII